MLDEWTQEERDQGWRYVDESLRDPEYYAFCRRRDLYPKPTTATTTQED